MICRRAKEVDLAGFLADAGDPELADFRAHYPSCPDCSAEVRAWEALHGSLRASDDHPAEELLLAIEERPDTMPPDERRRVEQHLARCLTCADELRALRRFDFTRLAPAAAVRPPRDWSAPLCWLGRGLWHPGFAYALVLLLLIPTIVGRLGGPDSRPVSPPAAAPPAPGPPAEMANEQRARAMVARPEPDAAAAARAGREADAELARKMEERDAAYLAAPRLGGVAPAERSSGFADAPAPRPPSAPPEAFFRQESARARAEPGWTAVPLVPGHPATVVGDALNLGLALEVPVPAEARGVAIEVRVRGGDGVRELRERFVAPLSASVLVRVPAAWLDVGEYRVEVRRADAGDRPPVATFTIGVR